MTDLAQLGLSIDAKPILDGLKTVDTALAKTATAAGALVTKIKTATGQMAAAFNSIGTKDLAGSTQRQMSAMVGGFQTANTQIRSIVADRVKQVTANALAGDKTQLNSTLMTGRAIIAAEKSNAAESLRISAARDKQAMAARLLPILSTGSVGLPTRSTSAFNATPDSGVTLSGIASVDKMRGTLASLKVEEAALHSARAAGTITSKEYARGMDSVTKATNLAVAGNTRARGVFRQTASAIASATFEITGAIFGLTAAAGILASPAVFGFKLLRTMEDTKLGMGAILISMGQLNGEAIKLPKALELAEGVTKRLQQNAMKYGVDMIALADTTKAVMASGLGGGLDLKEVEEIALLGSIAVKTIGLDAKQSVQEIRDLVAGGIQAGSSTLAVALGIGNKEVKAWREAGTLFVNLKTAMKGFQDTAILKQETLNGAWTIFVQKVGLLLANGPAFDLIKQKLTDISNAIGGFNEGTQQFEFNPELVKTVEEYYAAFKLVVTALKDAATVIVSLVPLVVELGKAFLILKAVNLAGTVGKGLLELGAAAFVATGKVDTLKTKLNGVGKNPIVQVIAVSIAWEGGQFVGTQLNKYFGDFFARELEKINKLIYNFGSNIKATLLDALAAVFQWGPMSRLLGIPQFFSNMADEIRRGGDLAAKAAADQAMRIAQIAKQYDSVQSEGGLRSTGKLDGGRDRLLAEEMRLVGGGRVTGKPKPAEDPDKGNKGGGSRAVDPQIAFMANLKKEVAILGMSEEAIQRYEISLMKLTASNRRLAETYTTTIFAFKAQQEAVKALNEETQKAFDANDAEIKAMQDLSGETAKAIKQLEFETSLLGLNTEEKLRAVVAEELSTNAYTKGNAALEERIVALRKMRDQQARIESLKAGTQTAKTEDFMANVAAADEFRFSGGDQKQADEMIKNITSGAEEAKGKLSEIDQVAANMAKNIQSSLADFLFDPFKDGLDGMLKGFGQMLQRMIAEAAAAQIMKSVFGAASGGTGDGLLGGALSFLGSLFASANGNAFAGGNVQAFASGGIMGPMGGMLNRPTVFPMANGGLGIGGEAAIEAVMPLKRGRDGKLGVAAGGGGGGNTTINVTVQGGQSAPDVRRAAGQGAREALGMMSGAQRYA